MHYIIDADIKNYFGSISHGILRELLDQRVKDGVIRKMIDKWLKAGIMESGNISYPDEGTPQGGIISPILSNIYLHYVLDEWFIVRFADDFILGFSDKSDAQRVMEVLPKRFAKYKLTLHPEKTKLIDLNSSRGESGRSFDFLGFTHYLGKSRKGYRVLKRKTSTKRLTRAITRMNDFIKKNRHMKLASTAKRPRLLQLKNVYEILKFLAVVKQKAESITLAFINR
jgi:group II intron reverse transcriptase/maturase